MIFKIQCSERVSEPMIDHEQNEQAGYRQLNLVGFTLDIMQPLALFKDVEGEMTVPLWLEMDDVLTVTAELVSSKLTGKKERNDLLEALLTTLGLEISGIFIDGSAENGYLVSICFSGKEDNELPVKVGLVTALLAAIRYKLPVSISAEAIATSSLVDQSVSTVAEPDDDSQLLEMLEKLKPEDMGKYPM